MNDLKCCTEKISWMPSPHELRLAEFTQILEFTHAAPRLGLFTLYVGTISLFGTFMAKPVIFSLLGGTSSILRAFRAEPVKKHPVGLIRSNHGLVQQGAC